MNSIKVDFAKTDEEVEMARGLCRQFVESQLENFPQHRKEITSYFGSEKWEKVLAELSAIHARPQGGILLARHGGRPVGCIMYHQLEPGVAEVKRLFVRADARGIGAGKALVTDVLVHLKNDGYTIVRLDTANFLTTAIALYEKSGFVKTPIPDGLPPELANIAVFMERQL